MAAPEELSRLRWVDNTEMDFRGIVWGVMYWIYVAPGRDQWRAVMNMLMNRRVL
jgi:hypothetical protein